MGIHNRHSVGHRGDVLPANNPYFSKRTFQDLRELSAAFEVFDTNPIVLDGQDLSQYTEVHYNRFGGVTELDVSEGINGNCTQLELKMRNDKVQMCQNLCFEIKMDRVQGLRLGSRFQEVENAYENGIAMWMNQRITNFAYIKAAASALPENIVNDPKNTDTVFRVPSTRMPNGANETGMPQLVRMLRNAIGRQGVSVRREEMTVLTNVDGYSALSVGQQELNTCCGEDNTSITGLAMHSAGFMAMEDIHAPIHSHTAEGTVCYVMAFPKRRMWMPVHIDLIEWETERRHVYFYGNGCFGFKTPDPRYLSVAKVIFVD